MKNKKAMSKLLTLLLLLCMIPADGASVFAADPQSFAEEDLSAGETITEEAFLSMREMELLDAEPNEAIMTTEILDGQPIDVMVVFTGQQYLDAMKHATIRKIYLGADITIPDGGGTVTTTSNKRTELIIDGTNPYAPTVAERSRVHTLEDKGRPIKIASLGWLRKITFQNVNLYTKYTGNLLPPFYKGGVMATASGINFSHEYVFDNVEFTGAQLIDSPYAKVVIRDSNLAGIIKRGLGGEFEVISASQIVFEGDNTFIMDNEINPLFSSANMIRLKDNVKDEIPEIRIAENASLEVVKRSAWNVDVTINDPYPSFVIAEEPFDFIVEDGAYFNFEGNYNFWNPLGSSIRKFTVGDGASCTVDLLGGIKGAITGVFDDDSVLRVKELRIGEGAEFRVYAEKSSDHPTIMLPGVDGVVEFNNPSYVSISSEKDYPILVKDRAIKAAIENFQYNNVRRIDYYYGNSANPVKSWYNSSGTTSFSVSFQLSNSFNNKGLVDDIKQSGYRGSTPLENMSMSQGGLITGYKPNVNKIEIHGTSSKIPTVDAVSEGERQIKGTGVPNALITVKIPNEEAQSIVVGQSVDGKYYGEWSFLLPEGWELKDGDSIEVWQTERYSTGNGNWASQNRSTSVFEVVQPKAMDLIGNNQERIDVTANEPADTLMFSLTPNRNTEFEKISYIIVQDPDSTVTINDKDQFDQLLQSGDGIIASGEIEKEMINDLTITPVHYNCKIFVMAEAERFYVEFDASNQSEEDKDGTYVTKSETVYYFDSIAYKNIFTNESVWWRGIDEDNSTAEDTVYLYGSDALYSSTPDPEYGIPYNGLGPASEIDGSGVILTLPEDQYDTFSFRHPEGLEQHWAGRLAYKGEDTGGEPGSKDKVLNGETKEIVFAGHPKNLMDYEDEPQANDGAHYFTFSYNRIKENWWDDVQVLFVDNVGNQIEFDGDSSTILFVPKDVEDGVALLKCSGFLKHGGYFSPPASDRYTPEAYYVLQSGDDFDFTTAQWNECENFAEDFDPKIDLYQSEGKKPVIYIRYSQESFSVREQYKVEDDLLGEGMVRVTETAAYESKGKHFDGYVADRAVIDYGADGTENVDAAFDNGDGEQTVTVSISNEQLNKVRQNGESISVTFYYTKDIDGNKIPDRDEVPVTVNWLGYGPDEDGVTLETATITARRNVELTVANDRDQGTAEHSIDAFGATWKFRGQTDEAQKKITPQGLEGAKDTVTFAYEKLGEDGSPLLDQYVKLSFWLLNHENMEEPIAGQPDRISYVSQHETLESSAPPISGHIFIGYRVDDGALQDSGEDQSFQVVNENGVTSVKLIYRVASGEISVSWVGYQSGGAMVDLGNKTYDGSLGSAGNISPDDIDVGEGWQLMANPPLGDDSLPPPPADVVFSEEPQFYQYSYEKHVDAADITVLHETSEEPRVTERYSSVQGGKFTVDGIFTRRDFMPSSYVIKDDQNKDIRRGNDFPLPVESADGDQSITISYGSLQANVDVMGIDEKGNILWSYRDDEADLGQRFGAQAQAVLRDGVAYQLKPEEEDYKTIEVARTGNEIVFQYEPVPQTANVIITMVEEDGTVIGYNSASLQPGDTIEVPSVSYYEPISEALQYQGDEPVYVITYKYRRQMQDVEILYLAEESGEGENNFVVLDSKKETARAGEMYTTYAIDIDGYYLNDWNVIHFLLEPDDEKEVGLSFFYCKGGNVVVHYGYEEDGQWVDHFLRRATVPQGFTYEIDWIDFSEEGLFHEEESPQKIEIENSNEVYHLKFSYENKTAAVQTEVFVDGQPVSEYSQKFRPVLGVNYELSLPLIRGSVLSEFEVTGQDISDVKIRAGGLNLGVITQDVGVKLYYSSAKEYEIPPGTIDQPYEGDQSVSGTGSPNTSILVEISGQGPGQTIVIGPDGQWSANLGSLSAGDVVEVHFNTDEGTKTIEKKVLVADLLTLDQPYGGDNRLSGTGTPGTEVEITIIGEDGAEKETKSVTIDENGVWRMELQEPLADGDVVTGSGARKNNHKTEEISEKAQKVEPSLVDQPYEHDTVIKGTGTPGDTVTITIKGGQGEEHGPYTTEIDENGNWSLTLPDPLKITDQVETVFSRPNRDLSVTVPSNVEKALDPKEPERKPDKIDPAPRADETSVMGTGSAGDIVNVVIKENNVIKETVEGIVVDPNGYWTADLANPLVEGEKVEVTFRPGAEDEAIFTEDVLPAEGPNPGEDDVKQPVDGDGTVSGTGNPGDKVLVEVRGKDQGDDEKPMFSSETMVDENGNWSVKLDKDLEEGDKVKVTFRPGEEDESSQTKETGPAEGPNPGEDDVKQPVDGDGTVSGTGNPGDKVLVEVRGKDQGDDEEPVFSSETTVDENGNWSVKLDKDLEEGDKVKVTFRPGEEDESSQTKETGPAEGPNPGEDDVKQPVDGDGTVSGTGNPGDKVLVEVHGKDQGDDEEPVFSSETTVDENGNWSVKLDKDLEEGDKVKVTFRPGEEDESSQTKETGPAEGPNPGEDDVKQPVDGDGTVSGTGNPGDKVLVEVRGKDQGDAEEPMFSSETTVDENGNWSVKLDKDLEEGDKVKVTFRPGEEDESSQTKETGPAEGPNPGEDDVKQPVEGDGTVSGTGNPGDKVLVEVRGKDQGNDEEPMFSSETTVDENGNWSVKLDKDLEEGDKVKVTFRPGEEDESSQTRETGPAEGPGSKDTVKDPKDGDGTVSGTGNPGDKVLVEVRGKDQGDEEEPVFSSETTVDENGNWSVKLDKDLEEGDKVKVTFRPGEEDEVSQTKETGPAEGPTPGEDDVKQPVDGDGTVSGTGNPGDKVLVEVRGKDQGDGEEPVFSSETTVDENGNWSVKLDKDLEEGDKVKVTFRPGEEDESSQTRETGPAEGPNPGEDDVKQPVDGDGTVSGTGNPGDKVLVEVRGKDQGDEEEPVFSSETTVDENGNWSVKLDKDLEEGDKVKVTFRPGEEDEVSQTKETGPAEGPTPGEDDVKQPVDGDGTVSGTGNPGDKVLVEVRGKDQGDEEEPVFSSETTVDENGNWSVKLDKDLEEGDKVEVTFIKPGETTSLIDKVQLPKDGIDLPPIGEKTISGTGGTPGETVTVKIIDAENTRETKQTKVGDDGRWSVELTDPLEDGDQVEVTFHKPDDDIPFTREADYPPDPEIPSVRPPQEGDQKVIGTGPSDNIIEVVIRDETGSPIENHGVKISDDNKWEANLDNPLNKNDEVEVIFPGPDQTNKISKETKKRPDEPDPGKSSGSKGGSIGNMADLLIRCLDEEEKLIHSEIRKEAIGAIVTVQAPELEGYQLKDENNKKIEIKNKDNEVTFHYSKKSGIDEPGDSQIHKAYISGYPDGTFRPDGSMSRAEAAVILYRVSEQLTVPANMGSIYTDVQPGQWHHQAIASLSEAGVISGYPDGSFRPDDMITREEFTALVVRFANVSSQSEREVFRDVEAQRWSFPAIYAAYEKGWVQGLADGSFQPGRTITRAEAVTIMNRVLERLHEGTPRATVNPFSDLSEHHWAYHEIMEAAEDHLI